MNDYRKMKLIMNELLDYCHSYHMNNAQISLDQLSDRWELTIHGDMAVKPDDLETLIEKLNSGRRPEIEEYYEDLLGLRTDEVNVDVLAAMIDQADYYYMNKELTLKVSRHTKQ